MYYWAAAPNPFQASRVVAPAGSLHNHAQHRSHRHSPSPLTRSSSATSAFHRRPRLYSNGRTASAQSGATDRIGAAATARDRKRPAPPKYRHSGRKREATSPPVGTSPESQTSSSSSHKTLASLPADASWPLPVSRALGPGAPHTPTVPERVRETIAAPPPFALQNHRRHNHQFLWPEDTSPSTRIQPSSPQLTATSGDYRLPYANIRPQLASPPTNSSFARRISHHLLDRHHYTKQQSTHPLERTPLPHHVAMPQDTTPAHKINISFSRTTDTLSSNSAATSLSGRTRMSTDPPSSADGSHPPRPFLPYQRYFINRNGRTYIADPTVPYPLPVDLPELNRQSMRTLMMLKLFGRPICSPVFQDKPPVRVLDLGCGTGFWSMKCHQYWAKKGHPNISFTGLDIVPIAVVPGATTAGASSGSSASSGDGSDAGPKPERDMKWRFVQHDIRRSPWPFVDGEFDLVMMQAVGLVAPESSSNQFMDELLRITRPGGVIEIWETDYIVRMLRPHVPVAGSGACRLVAEDGSEDSDADTDSALSATDSDEDGSSEEGERTASSLGAYVMTANTPMSSPLNNFLVEYNSWVTKALDARSLSPVPCTIINPLLLQEEGLTGIGSKRLAVPLSEVKWEREGVGGVVTKDGKSYVKGLRGGSEANDSGSSSSAGKVKALSASQAALRRTALLTVVQLIQSLEPLLREVSGKSQDEWDGWQGKMMNDLLKENGTSWGECLELGAWWARKK